MAGNSQQLQERDQGSLQLSLFDAKANARVPIERWLVTAPYLGGALTGNKAEF
jgi:hypothetical protein